MSLPEPVRGFPAPDADELADDELLARLAKQLQRRDAKARAQKALATLRQRRAKNKLSSHHCGDILPYRYSQNAKYKLSRDVISIVAFAHLARILSKTDVEYLAGHVESLEEAMAILQLEDDVPHSWYNMYLTWREINGKMALQFFLGKSLLQTLP